MNKFSVAIIGGGISGWMIAKRISIRFPGADIMIFDKSSTEFVDHPFHLHRLIPDIPQLAHLPSATLKTNVFTGSEFVSNPTILDVNNYSRKVFEGKIQITNCDNVSDLKIYPIRKDELIKYFATNDARIHFEEVKSIDTYTKELQTCQTTYDYDYLINTIPLPIFLKICSLPHSIVFEAKPFFSAAIKIGETNLYQMCYNSDKSNNITRTTLLNDTLFVELMSDWYTIFDLEFLYSLYGIEGKDAPKIHKLYPGRFIPINRDTRKPLFYYLTETFDVMCIGRFGAWTHKVANDVWEDTDFICDLIFTKEQVKKFK